MRSITRRWPSSNNGSRKNDYLTVSHVPFAARLQAWRHTGGDSQAAVHPVTVRCRGASAYLAIAFFAPLMYYKVLSPHPSLRSFIGCYWILKTGARFATRQEVIIPDGYGEIIFNLGAPYPWQPAGSGPSRVICHTHLVGQRDTSVTVALPARLYQVGVKLKPTAMRNLLGLPPAELTNSLVHASDVGSHALSELAERLHEAACEDRQGQLLDDFFGQKPGIGGKADAVTGQALHCILGQKGILRVDELKNDLGIDYRTLERRFKTTTGLTPKEFARIIRFKNAYKAFRGNQARDAFFFLDCGYYDQSHFIREFRHFMGSTPSAFHAGRTPVSDAILRQGLSEGVRSEE